jgi:hypothetical protein
MTDLTPFTVWTPCNPVTLLGSTALTSFTLLPSLATELRLTIFNFALPTVRDDEECLVKHRKYRALYLTL